MRTEYGASNMLIMNHTVPIEISTPVTRFFPIRIRTTIAATNGISAVATRA